MHNITELQHLDLSSVSLHYAARRHRLQLLARSIAAALRRVAAVAARMRAQWQRRRKARATYLALSRLDSRTLRDLGFDRSEIQSVAAEISGSADSTRVLTRRPDMARA
jgi:uncharacterized protein YjiS (DUF1127 family)